MCRAVRTLATGLRRTRAAQSRRSSASGLGGALLQQGEELRIVVEAHQVRIAGGPIDVAEAGIERLLQRVDRLALALQDAIRAGGVIEDVGVVRTQRCRHLEMLDCLLAALQL